MNQNIWKLYKNSERGKRAIDLFTLGEDEFIDVRAQKIFQKYNEYFGGLDVEDYFIDNCILFFHNMVADKLFYEGEENVETYFERLIDNLEICIIEEISEGELRKIENEAPLICKGDYKTYCAILSEISLMLYFDFPDVFFPILFREQFDVFMKILDVLDIQMPELPSKSDKRGRLMFYVKLNNCISEFAKQNSLTGAETCACIYDFALMFLDEERLGDSKMPKPTNVWLTGASKGDFKTFLENPVNGAKSVWTCNENTKRGDIIVMYVLYPYSCIQSIWRADIDGIYTPFNYYNSRTRVVDGIVIPQITLKEIKFDPYFSKLPIVRKNFQGVNGVKFSANDYIELQRLLIEKGFDVSVLPQLYSPDLEFSVTLNNEKDVEEKLLIPLLDKLGYKENDWARQLSQKAGRNEKIIPDFVFLPKGEVHFQNAPMIIEAKYDMSSNIEQTKAYNQALSYARMMRASYFAICDKYRIIVYKEKKGNFNRFNPIFENHWQNLNNKETFRELKSIIGKMYITTI